MKIAFLDVQYSDENSTARAAILLAELWTDGTARWMNVVDVSEVAPYQPGEFFRRELPCLQKALASAPEKPSAIVIDGYVWLDQSGRPGLGAKLFQTLGETTSVIGVAKTRFHDAPGIDVYRNRSSTPLIVTAAGCNELDAAEQVRTMHGSFRIPTLLKLVDQLARGNVGQ
jgi:deoxyribonuclease V